jgi:hypothetical protein
LPFYSLDEFFIGWLAVMCWLADGLKITARLFWGHDQTSVLVMTLIL